MRIRQAIVLFMIITMIASVMAGCMTTNPSGEAAKKSSPPTKAAPAKGEDNGFYKPYEKPKEKEKPVYNEKTGDYEFSWGGVHGDGDPYANDKEGDQFCIFCKGTVIDDKYMSDIKDETLKGNINKFTDAVGRTDFTEFNDLKNDPEYTKRGKFVKGALGIPETDTSATTGGIISAPTSGAVNKPSPDTGSSPPATQTPSSERINKEYGSGEPPVLGKEYTDKYGYWGGVTKEDQLKNNEAYTPMTNDEIDKRGDMVYRTAGPREGWYVFYETSSNGNVVAQGRCYDATGQPCLGYYDEYGNINIDKPLKQK